VIVFVYTTLLAESVTCSRIWYEAAGPRFPTVAVRVVTPAPVAVIQLELPRSQRYCHWYE